MCTVVCWCCCHATPALAVLLPYHNNVFPGWLPKILLTWSGWVEGRPNGGQHAERDSHGIFILILFMFVAGRPQPAVRWLINGDVVDDQYEHNFGDVIENRLMRPPLYRENLGAIFTCQAVNTAIVKPKESSYMLDMLRKYQYFTPHHPPCSMDGMDGHELGVDACGCRVYFPREGVETI